MSKHLNDKQGVMRALIWAAQPYTVCLPQCVHTPGGCLVLVCFHEKYTFFTMSRYKIRQCNSHETANVKKTFNNEYLFEF